jgi:hypothetical protein
MPAAPSTADGLLARLGPTAHPLYWVCGVHLLLAFLLFDPKPFLGGDNYWYMLLGESLRSGDGYRDLWLPAMPPHTRYPPVYPAALALLGFVANAPLLFKLFSAACTTGIAALAFLLANERTGDRQLAVMAGLLVGAAPIVVEYSHWVLSEPLFTFLSMMALFAFTRDGDGKNPKTLAIGTVAVILASLTRSAGYPLILAVVIAFAVRRRWKQCAIFFGVVVIALGAWWLRNKMAVSGDLPYSQWIMFRDPYNPELGTVTMGEMVARFWFNFKRYTLAILPQSVAGRDVTGSVAGLYGVVLAVPIIIAAFRNIKRPRVVELYFIFYMGLILLWPEAWGDQRLLLPVLPVAILLMLEGLAWLARLVAKTDQRTALATFVAAVALVAVAAFGNVRIMSSAVDCTRQYWRGDRFACYPVPATDFINVASWASQGTPTGSVVINRKPQIFYWYARRRGDNYPYSTNPDSILNFMNNQGASYVVVDRWSATTYRFLVPAIQANTQLFGLAHQEGDPPTFLLTYRPGGGR